MKEEVEEVEAEEEAEEEDEGPLLYASSGLVQGTCHSQAISPA